MKKLRLILGDQLNIEHSWFQQVDTNTIYIMMEMQQELEYTHHHIQKVVAFFVSMRTFCQELQSIGHNVIYLNIKDPNNQQKLIDNLQSIIVKENIDHFEYLLPDEYRLDKQLSEFCSSLLITHSYYDTEHFLTSRETLGTFFKGKKQYVMESFYRMMRKKYSILLDANDQPLGGSWNYDKHNRSKLPKSHKVPEPKIFNNNITEIYESIIATGAKTIGTINVEHFIWPVSRTQAIELLDYFIDYLLQDFGSYQDAMDADYWSLYHSRISFALNVKMISPLEVIKRVEDHWYNHQDEISLSQAEGFIRQILGWREYMRGIYWLKMPDYANLNYFEHSKNLPSWFWTGETKMKCMSHAIKQSLEYTYAHHIQRLMITGNFALLAGIDPDEVDEWYLGIYIDAIEWVEITNTRGMSQYADGGIVATKPYVSSGNYINKMSSYCKSCHYNVKDKVGDNACPFNSLYWHFMMRNRDQLEKNPRIGMAYRTWDKMDDLKKDDLLKKGDQIIHNIEEI